MVEVSEVARTRRAEAARIARDLVLVEDLLTLVGVAEYGFASLFGGGTTIQLSVDADSRLVTGDGSVLRENLDESVLIGLAGTVSHDVVTPRSGILLDPQSATGECRAWIAFATPRQVTADELIVADLFAQAFALAVDRVVLLDEAAERADQLRAAIESHGVIGQAVGILVERHKVRPGEAFDLLRTSSQNRNIKLRELAARVIESGEEPEVA